MQLMNIKILLFILVLNINPGNVSCEQAKPFVSTQQWEENTKGYSFNENFKTMKPKKDNKKHSNNNWNSIFSGLSKAKFILIAVVIIILIVLIVFLILGIFKDLRWRVPKTGTEINVTNIENIENADLESLLQQAINSGSFKDAIRFKYLILIRTLNKQNLITWKKDKTNGHYISEMYGKNGFDLFKNITIRFERICYGEEDIHENDYQRLIPLFEQINVIVLSREQ